MDSDSAPDIERLLEERTWLRRVARALVHDEERAEDLTQDTYVAALERAPAHVERPRGWLGTVLRNLWRNDARARRRRLAREAVVATPERIELTPPALVERAEQVERLGRALLELPEPYRATLLLRYFEDLPPREVARRMGVPVETVRTRHKRALAQLAERLDAGPGSRRAWAPALLAWAGGAELSAVGTVAGALLMKKILVAAAVLVLLLGGAGVWQGWFQGRGGSAGSSGPALESGRTLPPEARGDAPSLVGAGGGSHPSPAPTLRGPYALQGSVIDRAGKPAPGVPVRLRPNLGRFLMPFPAAPSLDSSPAARPVLAETTSDAAGAFVLEGLAHGVRYDVEAVPAAPRFGSSMVIEVWPWAEPRAVLVVGEGAALRGRVVDGQGRGVPAWVEASELLSDSAAVRFAGRWHALFLRTDADGRFEIAAAPSGFVLLSAIAPGRGARRAAPQRVPAEGDVLVRLAEPGGASLAGHVRDEAGRPIAGVRVTAESHRVPSGPLAEQLFVTATTDAEGAYRADGLLPGRIQEIHVEARGYVRTNLLGYDLPLSAGKVAEFDLLLAREVVVEGRVVDPEGRALPGAVVRAHPDLPAPDFRVLRGGWSATTDGEGRFRVDALPLAALSLEAEHPGHATARSEVLRPVAGGPVLQVRLVLAAVAVEGTVAIGTARRADGTAVPGTLAVALPVMDGKPWPRDGPPRYAPCALDGSFRFETLDPALAWRVAANAPGYASQVVTLGAGVPRAPLELRLDPRAEVRGRVLDRSGVGVVDAKVRWHGEAGAGGDTTTALDGGFTLGTLRPGVYELEAVDAMGQRGGPSARVEVSASVPTPPATLRIDELHLLGGVVVDAEGKPLLGRMVSLGGWGRGSYVYTDPDGRFLFTLFGAGEFALAIRTETVGGVFATGRTDHRLVHAERRRPPVEVTLLDAEGRAAEGGEVWIRTGLSMEGRRSSGTGARAGGGRFRADIEPDEESFDVEVASLTDAAGRRLNVRPQTFKDLDPRKGPFTLRLEAGRVVRGRVHDGAGRGVPDVRVVVVSTSAYGDQMRFPHLRGRGAVETGPDGAFVAVGLPEGELAVGLVPVAGFVEPRPVVLGPAQGEAVLALERGLGVSGLVLDGNGRSVGSATVWVRPTREMRAGYPERGPLPTFVEGGWNVQTDGEGRFEVLGVPPDARVAVTAQAGPPWLPATVPDVPAGRDDVVVRLVAGVFVEGELLGEGWNEERELRVALSAPGAEDPRFASRVADQTVPRGQHRFRVGPVPPGPYDLAVYADGYHEALALERAVRAPSPGLRVTLPTARHVVGRIVGADVGAFRLNVIQADSRTETGVDGAGAFRLLNARPGRVTVFVHRDGDPRFGLREDVEPTAGPIEVALQEGRAIECRVEGLPAGVKTRLEARAQGPFGTQRAKGGADGRARIVGLPPGIYDVEVWCYAGDEPRILTARQVVAGSAEVVLTYPAR